MHAEPLSLTKLVMKQLLSLIQKAECYPYIKCLLLSFLGTVENNSLDIKVKKYILKNIYCRHCIGQAS